MRHAIAWIAFFLGAAAVAGGADAPGTSGLPVMAVGLTLMLAAAATLWRMEGGIQ